MRLHTTRIDDRFVYPCSKGDLRAAMGADLLTWAWFGINPEFRFDSRQTHAPKLEGRVLLSVSVSANSSYLCIYRVPREAWNPYLRRQVVGMMRGVIRPWIEKMQTRPETARDGREELLVEFVDGRLKTHVAYLHLDAYRPPSED